MKGRIALSALLALSCVLAGCSTTESRSAPASPGVPELPPSCRTGCVTPYGEVLGVTAGGVTAHSNCNPGCLRLQPNTWGGTYTGLKWQCVEFVRRWLIETRRVTYGDVDVAADIWGKITAVKRLADGLALPLVSHPNGAPDPPQVGDLLVYGREYRGTGHVAVITRVDVGGRSIEVAEQNLLNQAWPDGYARRIDLVKEHGKFWVLDPYLIGWKRISSEGSRPNRRGGRSMPDGSRDLQMPQPSGCSPVADGYRYCSTPLPHRGGMLQTVDTTCQRSEGWCIRPLQNSCF
jgi:CHAP domain